MKSGKTIHKSLLCHTGSLRQTDVLYHAGGLRHIKGLCHADDLRHAGGLRHIKGLCHADALRHAGGLYHTNGLYHVHKPGQAFYRTVLLAVICLASVVMLAGCASVNSVMQSAVSGLPTWYYAPQNRVPAGRTAFLGEGSSENRRQAELLAYSGITDSVSAYLGTTLGQAEYRELTSQGTIETYGLTITERFSQEENGVYTFILLAAADTELLENYRSPQARENTARIQKVEELVRRGDELIKTNRDMSGVKLYMQSLVLSHGLDMADEYSFESILSEVLSIIGSSSIVISAEDRSAPSCTLTAVRRAAALASPIEDCDIRAVYSATDSRNESYMDHYVFTTDTDGTLYFSPMNHTISEAGSIVFTFDLEEEITALAEAAPEAARAVMDSIDSVKAVFYYSKGYKMGVIGVASLDYALLREFTGGSETTGYIFSRFAADGISASMYAPQSDLSDAELIDVFRSSFPWTGCLYITRTGITDEIYSSTGTVAVVTEGSAVLYSLDTEKEVYSTVVYATGFGHSYGSAREDSFVRIANQFYSLLKSAYK